MDTLYVPPVIVAQGTGVSARRVKALSPVAARLQTSVPSERRLRSYCLCCYPRPNPQCSLAQKYIETYGARAMVLVAPSAPDLGPSLRRLAPESEGLSGAAFDRAVADALRPGSAEEFARRWLLSPPGAEAPDALAVAAHVTRSGGINTRVSEREASRRLCNARGRLSRVLQAAVCVCVCVCGGVGGGGGRLASPALVPPASIAASIATDHFFFQSQLLEELRAQPVELEPFPIPMMLVGSAGDALFPPYSDVSGAPRRSSPNRSACPNGPPARTDRPLACVLVSVVS